MAAKKRARERVVPVPKEELDEAVEAFGSDPLAGLAEILGVDRDDIEVVDVEEEEPP